MNFLEEHPWTTSLTLIFMMISTFVLPSPLQDFMMSVNFNNITQNPETVIEPFIVLPIVISGELMIRLISGLIGAIIGLISGLFIELFIEGKDQNDNCIL